MPTTARQHLGVVEENASSPITSLHLASHFAKADVSSEVSPPLDAGNLGQAVFCSAPQHEQEEKRLLAKAAGKHAKTSYHGLTWCFGRFRAAIGGDPLMLVFVEMTIYPKGRSV
jgi:hypothetical protein